MAAGSAKGWPEPPAGWYPDPYVPSTWRWWDGWTWTSKTSDVRPPTPSRWAWVLDSPATTRLNRVMVIASGAAAGIGIALLVASAASRRPIPGLPFLLIPAIPILVVGQLWCIGVSAARNPQPKGGSWWDRVKEQQRRQRNPRKYLVPGLSRSAAWLLASVAVAVWFTAMSTAFVGDSSEPVATAPAGCARAVSHNGEVRCVSERDYERAQAGPERFTIAILTCFFVGHFALELSEYRLRRPKEASSLLSPD